LIVTSAIFVKKIGSRVHSDSEFGRRGRGVSYIDAREEKVPAWILLRKNFQNGVLARSVTKISLILIYNKELHSLYSYLLLLGA
jgi:hypothetical protein